MACWMALVSSVAALSARQAGAQSDYAEAKSYPVSAFLIEYALDATGQPDPQELLDSEVELREVPSGFLAPSPQALSTRVRLSAVPVGARFHPGALRAVSRALVDELNRQGLGGVLVTIPDIDVNGARDLRPAGETRLRLRIWIGRVENVATVADGERFEDQSLDARSNRPEYEWIREGSPVQAGGADALLRPQAIDDYAARLSRQPGRMVNATLRPGELSGTSRLEYHVAEQKPWLAYAQLSNTGTDATTLRRERFGFSHTQLTGHDDVLRLDYVTGDFDSVHAFYGEYGGPIWRMPRLRWLVDGSWSHYDASEIGVTNQDFKGDQWETGGRLTANVFQHGDFFLDAFAGAHWTNISVENALDGSTSEDFFMPEAGLFATRVGQVWSLNFESSISHNVSSVAGTDQGAGSDSDILGGGEDAKKDFTLLKFQGELSAYVAPLLHRWDWLKESELGSYDFAHELAFTTQGQVSLGARHLVPQLQQIVGGLYTVRGYDQAATAGDTALMGSAEYRVHLPRLFDTAQPVPVPVIGSFRYRPENAFAFPDWDFIARVFVDAGWVKEYAGPKATRNEGSLYGLGFGGELRLLRNFSARLDIAWPEHTLDNNEPQLDKPEFHGVVTLMY